MSEPLSPEQEARAHALAARIQARSADAVRAMARRLVASADDTLCGDTEFAPRDHARGIGAEASAEHLPRTVGPPPPPATAPTASDPPPSTGTGSRRSRRSAGRPPAGAPTTTAGSAARDPAPGADGAG
jgi:hypothetical protein